MTIGIYALYWEEQELIYVGLSQNIEYRFRDHKRDMRRREHTNYKVQETYNLYGYPILIILEKCDLLELNQKEILWTNELDTINNGLNIIEAGQVGFGPNSNNSKYNKLQVLKVFRLVSSTRYFSFEEISVITNTSKSLVQCILDGKSHLWLQSRYPFRYNLMIHRKVERYSDRNCLAATYRMFQKELPVVVSPEGKEYTVENIRKFCIEHNLYNTHLGAVIRKQRKSHKGWVLKRTLS